MRYILGSTFAITASFTILILGIVILYTYYIYIYVTINNANDRRKSIVKVLLKRTFFNVKCIIVSANLLVCAKCENVLTLSVTLQFYIMYLPGRESKLASHGE